MLGGGRFYRHTEETPQQKPPTGLRMGVSFRFIFYELRLCLEFREKSEML